MKQLSTLNIVLVCMLATTVAPASTFDECWVVTEVLSIEELSLFDNGSKSVPAGVNPDGKAQYTYKNLLTLKVNEVANGPGSSSNCQAMKNTEQKVIVDELNALHGAQVGDSLKLIRVRRVQVFGTDAKAYSERWYFQ